MAAQHDRLADAIEKRTERADAEFQAEVAGEGGEE